SPWCYRSPRGTGSQSGEPPTRIKHVKTVVSETDTFGDTAKDGTYVRWIDESTCVGGVGRSYGRMTASPQSQRTPGRAAASALATVARAPMRSSFLPVSLVSAVAGAALVLGVGAAFGLFDRSTSKTVVVAPQPQPAASTPATARSTAPLPATFDAARIYARRSPGVVTIFSYFGTDPNADAAQGSGFVVSRSEERRVGKECRSRGWRGQVIKKRKLRPWR